MKTGTTSAIKSELDQCVSKLKALLQQLEPADRLAFTNELMLRLMPDRKKANSASDKLSRKHKKPLAGLSNVQMQLIKKLSEDTDRLFDLGGGDRA
ncbi:MAG: hypothetical protein JNL88_11255 [Bacteroidia bacterium]|nr:hypothetical protein [Bacteroidia bacterium]